MSSKPTFRIEIPLLLLQSGVFKTSQVLKTHYALYGGLAFPLTPYLYSECQKFSEMPWSDGAGRDFLDLINITVRDHPCIDLPTNWGGIQDEVKTYRERMAELEARLGVLEKKGPDLRRVDRAIACLNAQVDLTHALIAAKHTSGGKDSTLPHSAAGDAFEEYRYTAPHGPNHQPHLGQSLNSSTAPYHPADRMGPTSAVLSRENPLDAAFRPMCAPARTSPGGFARTAAPWVPPAPKDTASTSGRATISPAAHSSPTAVIDIAGAFKPLVQTFAELCADMYERGHAAATNEGEESPVASKPNSTVHRSQKMNKNTTATGPKRDFNQESGIATASPSHLTSKLGGEQAPTLDTQEDRFTSASSDIPEEESISGESEAWSQLGSCV